MTRTLPDYTTKYKLSNVFGQLDDAELAARINPISMLDRAGHVIWYDDFEGATRKWVESGSGTGNDAFLSSTRCHIGSQSMKMITGSDTAQHAKIVKRLDVLPSAKYGYEFYFQIDGEVDYLWLKINTFDGSREREAKLKIDITNSKLRLHIKPATTVDFVTGLNFSTANSHFHYIKLTYDLSTYFYDRLVFQGVTYDLSAYEMLSQGATTDNYTNIALWVYGNVGENAVCYIDNFVVTMDEP